MPSLTGHYRDILQSELDRAVKERERLDAAIDYLKSRLGIDGEEAVPQPNRNVDDGPRIGPDVIPADAINPGRFYGFTAARATRELLEMVGRERPLRTQEIFNAITKGGAKIADPDSLTKALKRHKAFYRVGRGLWGLSEWYPRSASQWAPGAGGQAGPDDDADGSDGSDLMVFRYNGES